jgi:MraZ protein
MWLGESSHTLDEKKRLSIPRRLLANQTADASGRIAFVLTLGFEGCLFLFTEANFEKAVARLETQPFAGEDKRNMQRLFFSKALRVELDEKNRLALPDKLRELAGIERDVTLVGVADRAEIWSKVRWETFESEHGRDFARLDRVLLGGGANPPQA